MTEFATSSRYSFERLKWSTAGVINGVWGEDPNGVDDIPCARVADFDRLRLTVSGQLPTIRAVTARERASRVLQRGDLLIEKSGGGDSQLVGCVVSYDGDNEAVCSNFIGRMLPAPEMYTRFWAYVHAWIYATRQNFVAIKQTTGIQNLDIEAYLDIRVPYPSMSDQEAIARFLDRQTNQFDTLVKAKQRMLELLAEKRRAIVAEAVMRGLNPAARFRPSGIDWLGDIPAHWEIRRIATLFTQRDERNQPELPLLEVSINSGVVIREFSNDKIEGTASDFNVYKVAQRNDIAFNKMRMWQGAVGVAPVDGLVSPDYTVAKPAPCLRPAYAGLLFRTDSFSAECGRNSQGITWDRLRLYWEGFRDIFMPLPPLPEQDAIVEAVEAETTKIDRLCAATEHSITLLKERRSALIAAAVTGQIDIPEAA